MSGGGCRPDRRAGERVSVGAGAMRWTPAAVTGGARRMKPNGPAMKRWASWASGRGSFTLEDAVKAHVGMQPSNVLAQLGYAVSVGALTLGEDGRYRLAEAPVSGPATPASGDESDTE